MTAPTLRAVEPSMDRLRARLPDLARMDLPSLEVLGRRADGTVDRLRGRPRRPAWPWLRIGIGVVVGLVAVVTAVALSTWSRRGSAPWSDDALDGLDRAREPGRSGFEPEIAAAAPRSAGGLSTAEASILSHDPADVTEG